MCDKQINVWHMFFLCTLVLHITVSETGNMLELPLFLITNTGWLQYEFGERLMNTQWNISTRHTVFIKESLALLLSFLNCFSPHCFPGFIPSQTKVFASLNLKLYPLQNLGRKRICLPKMSEKLLGLILLTEAPI